MMRPHDENDKVMWFEDPAKKKTGGKTKAKKEKVGLSDLSKFIVKSFRKSQLDLDAEV